MRKQNNIQIHCPHRAQSLTPWSNCHWRGIPKSPVLSPKRISFSAKVCIWYGFKYPLSSYMYEKVVIEMSWKISSFPANLLCLFSPCMTTVGFAPASSWQLRFQPWAQASCSPHLGFRTHPGLQAQLLCCSFHAALSSSLSWDHIWVAGRTQTFFLLTSSKHSSTHSSLFCLFLCLPPTVTAMPSLPWGPRTRSSWAPHSGDAGDSASRVTQRRKSILSICWGPWELPQHLHSLLQRGSPTGLLHSNFAGPCMQMAGWRAHDHDCIRGLFPNSRMQACLFLAFGTTLKLTKKKILLQIPDILSYFLTPLLRLLLKENTITDYL